MNKDINFLSCGCIYFWFLVFIVIVSIEKLETEHDHFIAWYHPSFTFGCEYFNSQCSKGWVISLSIKSSFLKLEIVCSDGIELSIMSQIDGLILSKQCTFLAISSTDLLDHFAHPLRGTMLNKTYFPCDYDF